MFNNIFGGNEQQHLEKREDQSYNKQKQFAVEQQLFQAVAGEDNTELIDREQRSTLIRWQQDPREVIEYIRYKLLGYALYEDGFWRKSPHGRAMVNHLFIDEIFDPFIVSVSSRIMANSNLAVVDSKMLLKKYFNNLAKTMIVKRERYGMRFEDFDDIDQLMKVIAIPSVYQSVKGWGKKVNATIYKSIEQNVEKGHDEKIKKGLFGIGG